MADQAEAAPQLFPGFIGVTAFTTAICQPSSVGDVLRFRGVDVREVVGVRPYDDIWRLLVDGEPGSGPLAAVDERLVAPLIAGSGSPRVVLQQLLLELGEVLGMQPTRGSDATALRDDLAVLTTAFNVGLGILLARRTGSGSDHAGAGSGGVAERLVQAWRGETDAEVVHVVDAVLGLVAEHGTTASTFAARVVASTGANAAACVVAGLSAIGGPRHGGATRGAMSMLRELQDDPAAAPAYVARQLEAKRRLPGIGHRVYRERDPRVPVLRELADRLDAPLAAAAAAYEQAAAEAVARRSDGRKLPTNPDLWLPVVLDGIGVPDDFMDAFLAGSRIAGWSAHSVEQVSSGGQLLRPDDIYAGPPARKLP